MDSQALEFYFNVKSPMEEPYFSYLVMLFTELDVFSIPEVGTFIKVVHPALRVGNEWIAPREEFIYDYKEEYQLETAQFLADKLKISLKEAKKLLEDISRYMFRYFDYQSHDLLIPGIGIMQHFPKNDTFTIKNIEEIRISTYGMKDLSIEKKEEKKTSWFRGVRNWFKIDKKKIDD
jgi:hypothetical protein